MIILELFVEGTEPLRNCCSKTERVTVDKLSRSQLEEFEKLLEGMFLREKRLTVIVGKMSIIYIFLNYFRRNVLKFNFRRIF